MSTPESFFPPLELTVRRNHKLNFKGFSDLNAFWTTEREAFRSLLGGNSATRVNPSAQYLNQINQRCAAVDAQFAEATQVLQRFKGPLSDNQKADLQRHLARIAVSINSVLQTGYAENEHGMWLSAEPSAKFVLDLAKASVDEAAYAFLYLRNAEFTINGASAMRGVWKAQLYEANLTSLRGEAETAAIKEITQNWKKESARLVEEAESEHNTAQVLHKEHADEITNQRKAAEQRATEFSDFLTACQKEQTTLLGQSRDDLKKLADTYDQHMKLQAPVEYWRKKKERHLAERASLQRWTIAVGLVSFGIVGIYVWLNFHEGQAGMVPWREIVGFFVLSTLSFWAVKILVRLLLSAIHLAEDAAEREVMAMTYMALVRGDGSPTKYMEEKDRALVLGPLFRPSATGVIDDGAPPHISEIITKLGRR